MALIYLVLFLTSFASFCAFVGFIPLPANLEELLGSYKSPWLVYGLFVAYMAFLIRFCIEFVCWDLSVFIRRKVKANLLVKR